MKYSFYPIDQQGTFDAMLHDFDDIPGGGKPAVTVIFSVSCVFLSIDDDGAKNFVNRFEDYPFILNF